MVGWFADELVAADMVVQIQNIHISDNVSGAGFLWEKQMLKLRWCVSPNDCLGAFRGKLDGLKDAITDIQRNLIVAKDLNVKAL